MNNPQQTYQHPTIACKHKLDVSNFEKFAIYLSNKMQMKIEMKYHRRSIEKDKVIECIDSIEKANLIDKFESLIPETKFQLQLKDVTLVIYEDFIEFNFGFTLDYFHLFQLHQENKLKSILFFQNLFNQLKSLGVNELHFGVFSDFNLGNNLNYTWKNVFSEMSKKTNYFVLEI
jgi:hypothetical protein